MLDEKIKNMAKAGALSGNPAMAGNLIDDLEKEIAKLKEDLNGHKQKYDSDLNKLKGDISQKADRSELADLEARMMQRLQDMFDQLRNMFPDKDSVNKRLKALEKQVSIPTMNS